jgi:uncharacterized protein (DUF1330 family)
MSAYIIFDITVTDPEGYEEYKKLASPTIEAHGGTYITRGGQLQVIEGTWQPNRLVILKFETIQKANNWINSPEYGVARKIRHKTATTHAITIEGV